MSGRDFHFSIDRGGTFTDVFAEVPDLKGQTKYRAIKLLSEDPQRYPDAPREGIRRILEDETGTPHPRQSPLNTSRIASIRMGTTVATNALLERKGEKTALLVTKGFRDLLHIGNQSRPDIFDLKIQKLSVLYDHVEEIDENVILPLGLEPGQRAGKNPEQVMTEQEKNQIQKGVTGELILVRQAPDAEHVRDALQRVKLLGIKSIAVVFKHAAIFPEHEELVGKIASEMGFEQISLSHDVMQMVKMVPRGYTATADAYLTPKIMRYVSGFKNGFDEGLKNIQILFMQSDGGLAPSDQFSGHRAILSGPAGGYVGYALSTSAQGLEKDQIIGFDMGGTSTDVSRYAGKFEHVLESTTAGVTIQAPQLDINTVAAGGGSRLVFRSGVFLVGPESVGAHPGPLCYRKGGGLAITDANLVLGRIVPDFFPHIFGPSEDQPLDFEVSQKALEEVTESINDYAKLKNQPTKTTDEVAMGFIRVANETMCRPIRALTQMKGYDVSAHVLACFGGAGGQHACAIARNLGMKSVFVHRYAGILSAVGIALADVVREEQEPCAQTLSKQNLTSLYQNLEELGQKAAQNLISQGFSEDQISIEMFLNLRYEGTDTATMTLVQPGDEKVEERYTQMYQREYGFTLQDRNIVVDDLRVRAAARSVTLPKSEEMVQNPGKLPDPALITSSYFEEGGRQDTPAYTLSSLEAGHIIEGPSVLIDKISTIVVEPGCRASITSSGDVKIDVGVASPVGIQQQEKLSGNGNIEIECDAIKLSIFSHRFMSIAEQMGLTLQRTSVSVNIKERLDFSCALFGPDGALVANAPHLPVHLGAMSEAVRFQVKYWGVGGPGEKEGIVEGDVLLSNHPQLAGGSHLPDITVITPVFDNNKIVFFVASRGHHADIGGISPGSMPPNSRTLAEEGAAIVSFKLVSNGVFKEQGISQILKDSGTRNLSDNVSDLRAQVAANNRGIQLVKNLIEESSLQVVTSYMRFIQENAEEAVREMLIEFSVWQGMEEVDTVYAEDQMDDGSIIKLAVTIDRKSGGNAIFDFQGTGTEVYGNWNAPPAVTYSAIIYSLRCMVTRDIPLNQGCMAPVSVKIPKGCLLSPSDDAAVVGGNVLTSQRVTDVILKAFDAAAASQGCLNNFTFGDHNMGYYETVAGGAGAGPGWHGRSGVHTHMSNTRITDPEILERRYPVVLHKFSLREGSGGAGKWRGGDGVVREIEFLRPMSAGILSERRACRPFGIQGGGSAQPGLNLLKRAKEDRLINMGSKASVKVCAGDRIILNTPGGGGCGIPENNDEMQQSSTSNKYVASNGYRVQSGSVSEYRRLQESA